jgi:uncharacterized membrane protein HdeD (DUF308 family)
MSKAIAWAVLILGAVHIVFGILRFQEPLAGAVADGFIGQFREPEIRRTAFWFLMAGPLLMLVGHLALQAVAAGNRAQLRTIGIYALLISVVGVLAFPVSPLWAPLVLSLLMLAAGYGKIG